MFLPDGGFKPLVLNLTRRAGHRDLKLTGLGAQIAAVNRQQRAASDCSERRCELQNNTRVPVRVRSKRITIEMCGNIPYFLQSRCTSAAGW